MLDAALGSMPHLVAIACAIGSAVAMYVPGEFLPFCIGVAMPFVQSHFAIADGTCVGPPVVITVSIAPA